MTAPCSIPMIIPSSQIASFTMDSEGYPSCSPREDAASLRVLQTICFIHYFFPTSSADPDSAIQRASLFRINLSLVVSINSAF